MNYALLAWNAAALLLYMTLAFIVALKRGRLDTVDAAWGGGFVVVAWLVAGLEPSARSFLLAILIDIWAIRLTNHIIQRSRKRPDDDPRYSALARKWGRANYWPRAFFSIFLLQGLLVLAVSLPVVFATSEPHDWATPVIIMGTVIWLKGFIVELLADRQLATFLADKNNKGKILDTGLWKRTRHPNYLGEITQWYGIGIIACSTKLGWIGLLGPLTLNVLIRYISGVPPIEREKQKDPSYQAYMQRTNAILPKLTAVARN